MIKQTMVRAALVAALIASAAPAMALKLTFDGFCDGLSTRVGANGVETGGSCGCVAGPVIGTAGTVNTQGTADSLTSPLYNGDRPLLFVIRKNKTWSVYETDGTEFNSGTWTKGCPVSRSQFSGGKRAGLDK